MQPPGRINLLNPVNRDHPLIRGRQFWWLAIPGLEGGNRMCDLLGLNHATLNNMTAGFGWRPTARSGAFGDILLDGSDDFLSGPATISVGNTFTVGVTFKSSDVTQQYGQIFNKTNADGSTDTWEIRFSSTSGVVEILSAIGGGFIDTQSPGALSNNTAYRLIGRYNGAALTLFLNGVQVATQAASGSVATNANTVKAGVRQAGQFPFIGTVDDMFASNRAWSDAEVFADYELSRRGYPDVLNRITGITYKSASGISGSPLRSKILNSAIIRAA